MLQKFVPRSFFTPRTPPLASALQLSIISFPIFFVFLLRYLLTIFIDLNTVGGSKNNHCAVSLELGTKLLKHIRIHHVVPVYWIRKNRVVLGSITLKMNTKRRTWGVQMTKIDLLHLIRTQDSRRTTSPAVWVSRDMFFRCGVNERASAPCVPRYSGPTGAHTLNTYSKYTTPSSCAHTRDALIPLNIYFTHLREESRASTQSCN